MVRRRTYKTGMFFLLVTTSLMLPAVYKRFTHSFHLNRCIAEIPYQASWEFPSLLTKEELLQVFSQKFFFLARGSQSFVFTSEDGNFVLKLFILDSSKKILESCKVASSYIPKKTGLVYAHLNLTNEDLPRLYLRGPAGKHSFIPLDQFRFALQQRVIPLSEELLRDYHEKSFSSFCQKVENVFSFIDWRSDQKIYNRDSRHISNFGFLGNELIEIDFGQYTLCPEDKRKKEKNRFSRNLIQWMKKETPEWESLIEAYIAQL